MGPHGGSPLKAGAKKKFVLGIVTSVFIRFRLRDAIPLLFKLIGQICAIIRRLCQRCKLGERERRRSPDRCVPINDPAFKRPDPLIYSQTYLMSLGIGVTWDNPDIQLFEGGVPVPSSSLKADTEYDNAVDQKAPGLAQRLGLNRLLVGFA